MELKSADAETCEQVEAGSNRTFMELKYRQIINVILKSIMF